MTNVIFSLNAKKAVYNGVAKEASRIALEASQEISNNPLRVEEYELLASDTTQAASLKDSIDFALRSIRNQYAAKGVENVYTIMLINDILRIAGDPTDESEPPLTQADYAHLDFKKSIFEHGELRALDEPYTDDYGVWISAYSPIKNKQNEVLAILGIDLPLGAYSIIDTQVNKTLMYALLPGILFSIFLSLLISRNLSKPIDELIGAIENIRDEKLETRIDSIRNDEFGTIGKAFNKMASDLQEKDLIRSKLNQAVSPAIAQKLLTEAIRPDGELMEGTVLFADVRGFTSLSETITARDTIVFINEFLNISVPIIQENGGIIEKFVGDEIFAVFGGPIPLEEDAIMAVQTAVKIQSKIKEHNKLKREKNLPELNIGIGICTGVMIGGVIGTANRNNYTLLGSTVNEGARICSMAKAQEIIISQSTYLRVQRAFEADKLPPILVKGKEFEIHTFSVKGII